MDLHEDDRDYDVYTDLMSDDPVVEAKYKDIEPFIQPGIIVDDGCGDGALLCRIAEDEPDSALVGVDLSAEMLERAEERIALERHADVVMALEQHDMTRAVPRFGRADTVISSSTTHELWSYDDGDGALKEYYRAKHMELERGGRFIVRDVVAPDDPEETVYLWLNGEDGGNEDILATFESAEERKEHLDSLSTRARFHRFCHDFSGRTYGGDPARPVEAVVDAVVEHEGRMLYGMAKRDAAEYLLTKDYTDNWNNEMRESFTHWTAQDHAAVLEEACFDVIHAESYTSDWIREHRFEGAAELYERTGDGFKPVDYPPTNTVVVGEKEVK